jgi:hypothetical protein
VTTPASTEQFADLARRGQEATTAAAQAVTSALQAYADAVTPRGSNAVDPHAAVSATFDLADQMLRAQRQYVGTTVALLTEAGEAFTAQASTAGETFKAQTEEAGRRVVDLTAETTRRATAGARNGVSV